MTVVFVARHFSYFRSYDAALQLLAARGHRVHLVVEKEESLGGRSAIEQLAASQPLVSFEVMNEHRDLPEAQLAKQLRLGLDYNRYLQPFYDDAPLLRQRARERAPRLLVSLLNLPLGAVWRWLVGRLLQRLDAAIAPPPEIGELLERLQPDVLLITPLVDLGSRQIDVLRAARARRIPTALCVWSWDHLTSKAYVREIPERVLVWNETQRHEAVTLHGVPADRIEVTGAQCFDKWFDRRPSRTRAEFCRELGLPSDRPLILYVCSALILGSPPEPPFVRRWLESIRASDDPAVATAAVLVRPHPSQAWRWRDVTLDDLGPVCIWGSNPVNEQARADYFDSLFHSDVVVGLNTSAFIEAGIVGRPVFAILEPEFRDNQEGTLHFRYLLEIGGGLLQTARELDAHRAQVTAALQRRGETEHPHRAFIERFVRPRGLAVAASPVFADAVEATAACTVQDAVRAPSIVTRAAVRFLTSTSGWLSSERDDARTARVQAIYARKAERRAHHAAIKQERAARWDARRAQREAERREQEAREAEKARLREEARAALQRERAARRDALHAERRAQREAAEREQQARREAEKAERVRLKEAARQQRVEARRAEKARLKQGAQQPREARAVERESLGEAGHQHREEAHDTAVRRQERAGLRADEQPRRGADAGSDRARAAVARHAEKRWLRRKHAVKMRVLTLYRRVFG
jgi:hypothetical protein